MSKAKVQGWLIRLASQNHELKGQSMRHGFLLPGLNESSQVVRLDSSTELQVLHFHFFQDDEMVSFVFAWNKLESDWETVRKHLFGKFNIKAPENESATDARFLLCSGNEDECSKMASRFIRGSATLSHAKHMTLDRGVHLLTEPRGFACYTQQESNLKLLLSGNHDLNQFERSVMLFALGLAYRESMMGMMKRMGKALQALKVDPKGVSETYAGLSLMRESIVLFDAQYYFHSPVIPERQELFMIAKRFMEVLHVQPLHEEMTQQLHEVSLLADHKLEDIQQRHRETMLEHQQQAAVRHERKMNNLNLMLGLLALGLTSIDLLSHPPSEWMQAIKGWLALW